MYGMNDSPMGRIGGDSEGIKGITDSPMTGRGDSARIRGI